MIRKRGKKSQLEISFGMIFSIILIVVFIAVAIYAVTMFLKFKECADTGLFKNELQTSIDRAWNGDEASFSKQLSISGIDKVCFGNLSLPVKGEFREEYNSLSRFESRDWNIFFYPFEKACDNQEGFFIKHLDIAEITKENNPNCFLVRNGKMELQIETSYGSLVRIS